MVAGGGIVGTWHALELVRAGFSVDHLEADAAPRGASVRNFGLVWVSGRRSGEELDVALRARRRWEEVCAAVPGVGFRPAGSLTVACTAAERAVMQAFSRHPDAGARSVTFLEPEELRACNPAVGGEVEGALHCARDAVVEPRLALGALRAHLAAEAAPGRYRFHAGRRVVAAEARTVVDTTGTRWDGDLVVVATGAAYDHLPGTEGFGARLRRVRLQMLETAPFAPRVTTALADADTLRYYPAYEVAPLGLLGEQGAVAARAPPPAAAGPASRRWAHHRRHPRLRRALRLRAERGPHGGALGRARRILGVDLPPVQRRWEGVYAQCADGGVCLREEIRPGVFLVTGPGGRGMTCAPAIAADTLTMAGVLA